MSRVMRNHFAYNTTAIYNCCAKNTMQIAYNEIETYSTYGINTESQPYDFIIAGNTINGNNPDGANPIAGIRVAGYGASNHAYNFIITDNIIWENDYSIVMDYIKDSLIENNVFNNPDTAVFNPSNIGSGVIVRENKGYDLPSWGLSAAAADPICLDQVELDFQWTSGGALLGTLGITIDSDGKYCGGWANLPSYVQEVVRMKVWAVGTAAPGVGNEIEVEIRLHAGASDEAYNTHAFTLANFVTEETNFAINDIIHWLVKSGDSAVLAALLGGDDVMVEIWHETAAGPDISTDARFRQATLEYV